MLKKYLFKNLGKKKELSVIDFTPNLNHSFNELKKVLITQNLNYN